MISGAVVEEASSVVEGNSVEPGAPGVTKLTEAQAERARVNKKSGLMKCRITAIGLDWILPFSHQKSDTSRIIHSEGVYFDDE